MVMDGGGVDPDDTLDGEVESAVDMSHQFNTLSGRETADYRNSWEMFERLLTQENSYRSGGDHDNWNYSESDDVVNLVVSVEDTGVGIPLHVQDRVFTPFMQVRKRSRSRFFKQCINLIMEIVNHNMCCTSRSSLSHLVSPTLFIIIYPRIMELEKWVQARFGDRMQ